MKISPRNLSLATAALISTLACLQPDLAQHRPTDTTHDDFAGPVKVAQINRVQTGGGPMMTQFDENQTAVSVSELQRFAANGHMIPNAPINASRSITINATFARVWAVQTDIENWPTWHP